ncbi:chaplin [Streptomyces sp. NRRL S-337]|uniref:chaplin n=1 Tax=Streptomyces sp. NRRL S-337 TaxID=1463900 RepID=UPI0004C9C8E1|nr:chaplin [Streptomyces sp. NRRL S-337]
MRQVARKGLITMAAAGGVLAAVAGYAHADAGAVGGAANSPGVGSGNNVQVPLHIPVNACGNTVNVVGLLNPAFGNHCANDGGHHTGHPGGPHQGGHHQGGHHQGGGGHHGGASAAGGTANSPGVGSGNNVQAPVDVPVNACGNSVSVVGLLNPVFGNDCANDAPVPGRPHQPGQPHQPGNPQHPGHPHHPGKPHHPGQPHHPGKPHHPGTGDHTGHHPHHPGKPHHPEQQHPGKPHHPATPQGGGHTPAVQPQTAPHSQVVPAPRQQLAETGAGAAGFAIPAAAGMLLGGAVLYRKARAAGR